MEHEKCDYIRAVLEGVAMNLGIILEKQRENGEIQDLVLTGGGAKGDTLSQILADVLGVRPVSYTHLDVYKRQHGTFVNFLDLSPDIQEDIIKRLDMESTSM